MTEKERQELIEKLALVIARADHKLSGYDEMARAALAVAEPVIREQCARMAEGELLHFPKLTKAGKGYNQACNEVAAAIREGGNE